jgi:predicted DNA-binding ribbon-helix-helix protein
VAGDVCTQLGRHCRHVCANEIAGQNATEANLLVGSAGADLQHLVDARGHLVGQGEFPETPQLSRAGRRAMKSLVVKHSIFIGGRKTSISLEDEFWKSLREIAAWRGETLSHLITRIDAERKFGNLSSASRLFVLRFYRDQQQSRTLVSVALDTSKSSVQN